MPWQKGQSGNPNGGRPGKPITDALRLELANPSSFKVPKRSPRALARAILDKACKGDVLAWREVTDRLEGKTPIAYGQSPDLEPIQLIITGVPRAIEDKAAQAIDVTPRARQD